MTVFLNIVSKVQQLLHKLSFSTSTEPKQIVVRAYKTEIDREYHQTWNSIVVATVSTCRELRREAYLDRTKTPHQYVGFETIDGVHLGYLHQAHQYLGGTYSLDARGLRTPFDEHGIVME